jgi:hypothetical protein
MSKNPNPASGHLRTLLAVHPLLASKTLHSPSSHDGSALSPAYSTVRHSCPGPFGPSCDDCRTARRFDLQAWQLKSPSCLAASQRAGMWRFRPFLESVLELFDVTCYSSCAPTE